MTTPVSLSALGLQIALFVAAVVVCGYLIKRLGVGVPSLGQRIRVVSLRNLGGKERLAVVEVDDRTLLLGLSPGGISTLTELAAATGGARESEELP